MRGECQGGRGSLDAMSLVLGQPTPFPPPEQVKELRFGAAALTPDGTLELWYELGAALRFVERIHVPVGGPLSAELVAWARPLIDLVHWIAGVSYFKAAVPSTISYAGSRPGPKAAQLLEALYSEGLGELALENGIDLPRPTFPSAPRGRPVAPARATATQPTATAGDTSVRPEAGVGRPGEGLLVPVGGGKDSIVAIEALRTTGERLTLFSVGTAKPIAATAALAGLPWLHASRRLDPQLLRYNAHGALNGHVPVTAVISSVACLVAALNGHSAVVMANERSASSGNVHAFGIEVNHQFSKGLRAERLFRAALTETMPCLSFFSVLRGASELAIARAFARLPRYHGAFTSCNAVFALDEARRAPSWCGDCPKCRFVFLALAPFMAPRELVSIFDGRNLLDDPRQYEGFSLLAAVGGEKPFECVGEAEEAIAAFRLLAADPDWRATKVVGRFAGEVLPQLGDDMGVPERVLAWSEDHEIPPSIAKHVRPLLGA